METNLVWRLSLRIVRVPKIPMSNFLTGSRLIEKDVGAFNDFVFVSIVPESCNIISRNMFLSKKKKNAS